MKYNGIIARLEQRIDSLNKQRATIHDNIQKVESKRNKDKDDRALLQSLYGKDAYCKGTIQGLVNEILAIDSDI